MLGLGTSADTSYRSWGTEEMATSKVQERIIELVLSRWELQRRPFSLADLGLQLRREFPRDELEREFLGGKLKNYIEYNLRHELRIVRHPQNPIVWGVVPSTVTDPADTLFAQASINNGRVQATEPTDRLPYVRYDFDLWKAFTTANTADRYIELGERVVVVEVSKGGAAPEKSLKIEPDDISDSREGYVTVASKIERWAERNKVDISKFKQSGRFGRKSLLEFMIEALSDEELRQLELPMNVIKILNSKRI